jgi:hypothetical protein
MGRSFDVVPDTSERIFFTPKHASESRQVDDAVYPHKMTVTKMVDVERRITSQICPSDFDSVLGE